MNNEFVFYIAAVITIGFILLGLAAFMYDRITKEIPPEDKDSNYMAAQKKLAAVFNAPFEYIRQNLKEKKFKALIPFSAYIFFWIYELVLFISLIKIA